jgi:hypothetical protein
MNMFGQPQQNGGGGFQKNPACLTCGSADPGNCFCKRNPLATSGTGWGTFANVQQQQVQLPAKVHIIVDSHIYEVNCDGTPIAQYVHAIKTQPK